MGPICGPRVIIFQKQNSDAFFTGHPAGIKRTMRPRVIHEEKKPTE